MAMSEVRAMLATTRGLISDYHGVDFFRLRESLGERPHKPSEKYEIFRLTYYVEYTTFDGKTCFPGNRCTWNVLSDGFPSLGSLRRWSRKHALQAQSVADLIVVHAVLRRSDDGKVEAKWQMPHVATTTTPMQSSISLQGSKVA
jgi:hypothetical protein